ncbi:MAG: DNA alkylation repair protein [Geobacteraceae bacterium GWC2_53_11]|nr:MAG: DNA alkylation repair protein [Geobacteraceae bacterium GWC2_53_11]
MTCSEIISYLRSKANPDNVAGMARFGISTKATLGVTIPILRELAKSHRRNHPLALELWKTGIHEARILASLVDDPKEVTEEQLEAWVIELDSWDVCDQCCANLFARTPFVWDKAVAWSSRPEEFVKRAGFVLMARLAVQERKASVESFQPFYELIRREAVDERNFVKKAVNWALREIGKRKDLPGAMALAEELAVMESRSARWIGRDALREFGRVKETITLRQIV